MAVRAGVLVATRVIHEGEVFLHEMPFMVTPMVLCHKRHSALYNCRPAWQLAELAVRDGVDLEAAPEPPVWKDGDTRVCQRITEAHGVTEADVLHAYAACVAGNTVTRVACTRSPRGCLQVPAQYGMFRVFVFLSQQ